MAEESLPSPHDRLFKETFSRIETARSFFEACLPPEIVRHIDWTTLKLEPGSFISAALREHSSDLLYSVRFRGEALLIYCLFEHQSKPDPWMALRCLGYMGDIWNGCRKASPKARKLPPILPIVLHQGGRKWKAKLQFAQLLEIPAEAAAVLRPFVPDFRCLLTDLSKISPEDLRGSVLMRVALALLKAARDGTLMATFERVQPLIAEMMASGQTGRMIEALLRYIYTVEAAATPEAVAAILARRPHPDIESAHMTIADQLINRGIEKGREQGIEKGLEKGIEQGREEGRRIALRENILEILEARFGAAPFEVREKLADSDDEEQLRRYLKAAISVESLTAFAVGL